MADGLNTMTWHGEIGALLPVFGLQPINDISWDFFYGFSVSRQKENGPSSGEAEAVLSLSFRVPGMGTDTIH
jgi:hypothetical protein